MVGLKKKLTLWWEKKTKFNPYGVWPTGICPVQAEGYTKDNKWYYFRARYSHAVLVICESEDDYGVKHLFKRELEYGNDFEAGWMTHDDAVRLATVWLNEYYEVMQELKLNKKWLKKLRSQS
jgi:hypothetical protein